MPQTILQQNQVDAERARHLAMQLAVQLNPQCRSKAEAYAVIGHLRELIEWEFGADQPVLRAVGKSG